MLSRQARYTARSGDLTELARYDHGVKFEYPTDNDGFVSHVARRGAEKTATGVLWFFGLLAFGACVALWNSLHAWLLLIVGMPFLAIKVLDSRKKREVDSQKAALPWAVRFTCADGSSATGATRYASQVDALAGSAKFGVIKTPDGTPKVLRGYEVVWDGPSGSRAVSEPSSSGFRPSQPLIKDQASGPRVQPAPKRPEPMSGDLVSQLKELAALQIAGTLSAEEFAAAKARLLDG